MTLYDIDELNDIDEPGELNSAPVYPPEPCAICGKPDQTHACMRCGKPVCMDPANYMNDSECGSWILDWWHDSAMKDDEDGNEFYCNACLEEVYPQSESENKPVDMTLDDSDEFP